MPDKKAFGEWLRTNAQKYLLEAAADEMAASYPDFSSKPYREKGFVPFFWRNIFVPIYSLIPWNIRRKLILFTSYPGGVRPHWNRQD